LIIHGPDLSQIPTQLPIQEDTRFSFVMQESFEFFSIPESKRDKYFLFDVKSCNYQTLLDYQAKNLFIYFKLKFIYQIRMSETFISFEEIITLSSQWFR
jgi:hypothetical protein